MSDLPRHELIKIAQQQLEQFSAQGCEVILHYKYTCNNCKERVTFEEPFLLYASGTCHQCGHTQEITKGGFMLMLIRK